LGVPLFQEQLLRMAMATAGFTGTEAEELRRAFGFKRSEARMKEVEGKLRAGMARQGIEGDAAEQIVHAITAFALYGFPECVVGETKIIDADTGRRVTIEDIVNGRARVEATLACDGDMRLVRRRILKATASGPRMVHRLRTALGREIVATAEHPLLTVDGWRALGSVQPGNRIATARSLPLPGHRRVSAIFLDARKRLLARTLAGSGARTRASLDVVPTAAHRLMVAAKTQRLVTWKEIGGATRLAVREIAAPSRAQQGYRRWVIARLARFLQSPGLARLAASELYWDRVTSIEPVGVRETFDLDIETDHNFLANDVVVHNSHASSFALLAYASAYLKAHHPAAFYAALLNNQPMGFYHPATIVKDAQRHGQRILPVDVTRSEWLCTVEGAAVRLGLRYVKGLRESAARALVAARAGRPFASPVDVAERVPLDRAERENLASIGAFAALGGTRRQNVWAMARALGGPLFSAAGAGALPAEDHARRMAGAHPVEPSPLREMTEIERLEADYGGTGVTIGRHPMALRRADLTRAGVVRARDLARERTGSRVRVAGSVIVRQRPGTAKGFVFLSLEDETGIANVIVTPQLFQRHRLALVTEPILLVEGVLQKQDGVVSVKAGRVQGLPPLAHNVPSHDFG
jgi:hypothetical protein